jgi:hypothetical protein
LQDRGSDYFGRLAVRKMPYSLQHQPLIASGEILVEVV